MIDILFLKHKRISCSCRRIENKVEIIKNEEEENIIDIEKFKDYKYFKKVVEYGKEFVSILKYNEWFKKNIFLGANEREKIIDIFMKMCNEIGFIIGNNINLNEHKKIILDFNEIKKICKKVVKLYNFQSTHTKETYWTEFQFKLLNEFNKNNKFTKLEIRNDYELLLYSYDIYVLTLFFILKEKEKEKEYIDNEKGNRNFFSGNIEKFVCPKCKRTIKITNGNIRNTKICERCRREENKKNRFEYSQKKRIINKLVNYKDIVTNIDNFDMEEFNVYIHSVTNKKKDVKKKNLKELKEYLEKVEKIIKK